MIPADTAKRRIRALAALLLVAATGCSAVSSGSSQPEAFPTKPGKAGGAAPSSSTQLTTPAAELAPRDPALRRYYLQVVRWRDCQQVFLCARVRVPLDYADPKGQTITLSVIKRPADDTDQRVGSLLVNPGGPGASGVRYVEGARSAFGRPLLERFDIVGFDPRGVGASTPVDCVPDAQLDTLIASDPDPDTTAEVKTSLRLLRRFGEGCRRRSGDLLAHVSTVEVARDMDILRALAGDRRLNYLGASYGTYLGAVYAELFPRRVGRMVLDGAVDPSVGSQQRNLVQAASFQKALRAYVADCVQRSGCPLGTDVDAGLDRISAFFDQLDAQPISGDGRRELSEGYAVLGVWLALYVKSYWPILTNALTAAFQGDGAQLLRLADYYTRREATGFPDNSNEVIYAVNCLDRPGRATLGSVERSVPRFEKASPVFGRIFAYGSLACVDWPAKAAEPAPRINAAGAAPILVVGTTRDPATPHEWAVALARQLQSGVLLSRRGDGHTGYLMGNACIDDTVESYLVDGTVPPDAKIC